MKVTIAGNGGAINDGLEYNSFIIGDDFLVETPPDIMNSLFSQSIDYTKIKSIFISHSHGDHTFGFPFLALRLFYDGINGPIQVFGPATIGEFLKEITILAFGKTHPVNNWIKENIRFIAVEALKTIQVNNILEITPFPVYHFTETYGIKVSGNSSVSKPFIYLADSKWDNTLLDYISGEEYQILLDMNGEPADRDKIHISERDIIDNALKHVHPKTMFYGTHLKKIKSSGNSQIEYVKAGTVLEL